MNESGKVLFMEVFDTDVLERITNDIITAYPSFTSFRAHWAFIVTWENVSIFNRTTSNEKVNYIIFICSGFCSRDVH